jgi:hypothetical protein
MAKAKTQSAVSFVKKTNTSCDRHSKSGTSKNKSSKNYKKSYKGQGR